MKQLMKTLFLSIFLLGQMGCQTLQGAWEDTKIAAHYLKEKGKALFEENRFESRLIQNQYDFYANHEDEYLPLQEEEVHPHAVEHPMPQPKAIPGEEGSPVPGIHSFYNPVATTKDVFTKIHFNTDQYTLRTKDQLASIKKIATYLKKHPTTYVFVEGHCDDRASEAYNLALGTRRSNHIRYLLIKQGVNPNQLYPISYGKEKPCVPGITAQARAKNRRVEFKIHKM